MEQAAGATAAGATAGAVADDLFAQSEEALRRAVAIAQAQGAKSLELRACMILSRLWQREGKQAAAEQLLADIYSWFTEGFDTPDLQEAQRLLATLRQHSPPAG
jgi:predicted ATPase